MVKEKPKTKSKLVSRWLCVSPETIRTVDYDKLTVLQTFGIARLTRFAAPSNTITLDFGNGEDG